jgi:hypothetical protein
MQIGRWLKIAACGSSGPPQYSGMDGETDKFAAGRVDHAIRAVYMALKANWT